MSKQICVVSEILSYSQAENLGIAIGDIVVSYDGIEISPENKLSNAVTKATEANKETVEFVLSRGEKIMAYTVTVGPLGVAYLSENIDQNSSADDTGTSTNYKTNYGVARGMCSLISFLGWALVILGVIAGAMGMLNGRGTSIIALVPGLGIMVSGFLMIMGSQVTMATVDNADHTREILAALNKR